MSTGLVVAAGIFTFRKAAPPAAPQADRRDFALLDDNGVKATLTTFRGKWALLFFGYTSCPDICPTTLLNVAKTLDAMGEAGKQIQPVFVTVDPERDTPAVLKDYLANFGGRFVGLTGTPAQIAAAAGAYQTFYRKVPIEGGYMMEHSSGLALLSPTGVYVRTFRPDDDPEDFAEELIAAMKDEQ
jgi:protein SCO1/2